MTVFYTKEHEWIKIEGEVGTVGISNYATEQLGDITFIELPDNDELVKKGDIVSGIESVKAASDIYTPMSGVIIEVNQDLENAPEKINESAEEEGWIFKIQISDMSEEKDLLSKEEYLKISSH